MKRDSDESKMHNAGFCGDPLFPYVAHSNGSYRAPIRDLIKHSINLSALGLLMD